MPSYNQVILMGNLTRDPELRYIPSGAAVCEFGIAVNRRWKDKNGNDKDEVGFFDCTAWARTAEVICEHLKKGNPIFIVGRLTQDRWQDQSSGASRSKVKIVVERFQFVGARGGAPSQQGAPAPEHDHAPEAEPVSDDNVPF